MGGLLALDQSTASTGWAWCEPGADPLWGHKRMGARATWEGGVYSDLRAFLLDRIDALSPKALSFESPFVPRPDRQQKTAAPFNPAVLRRSYGFVAHIVEIAETCGLDCYEMQSAEFTKFFTGRGRFPGDTYEQKRAAKKAATVAACAARGWRVTHDEADALALLMFTEWKLYPQTALQRRMVLKVPRGPLFELPAKTEVFADR